MDVRVGSAEFDAQYQTVYVGWCEFDTVTAMDVRVGWCEFDTTVSVDCRVGWAELDCLAPYVEIPPFYPGGGQSRYHGLFEKNHDLRLALEDEDEEAVMVALMEFAQNVL